MLLLAIKARETAEERVSKKENGSPGFHTCMPTRAKVTQRRERYSRNRIGFLIPAILQRSCMRSSSSCGSDSLRHSR